MNDFHLIVDKNQIAVRKISIITSGSVNVYTVKFSFSEDWVDLRKIVTFKAGNESKSIILDNTNTCIIPWEPISAPNLMLYVGICGLRDSNIVLPTIWARLGNILVGSNIGDEPQPPTPDIWEQILRKIPIPMSSEDLRKILIDGGIDNGR